MLKNRQKAKANPIYEEVPKMGTKKINLLLSIAICFSNMNWSEMFICKLYSDNIRWSTFVSCNWLLLNKPANQIAHYWIIVNRRKEL